VAAGATANLAVGTLFAWSLMAEQAAADVGAAGTTTSAVFATATAIFAVALLAVGRLDPQPAPRFVLVAAAAAAGSRLGLAAVSPHPVTLWCGVGLLFGAATGLAYGVAAGVAARAPAARRGAVTGVVVAAYAAGPILLGAVGPRLVAVAGWRACLGGLAVAVTVLLLVAAGLAPGDRHRHRRDENDGSAAKPFGRGTVLLLWLVFAGGVAPSLLVVGQRRSGLALALAATVGSTLRGAFDHFDPPLLGRPLLVVIWPRIPRQQDVPHVIESDIVARAHAAQAECVHSRAHQKPWVAVPSWPH